MSHQDPDTPSAPVDDAPSPSDPEATAHAAEAAPVEEDDGLPGEPAAPAAAYELPDTAEEPEAAPDDPLAAAHRERDEYLDALRRKQAEFENFRKRMMREGATQRITGHAEVAERMLDVLDDFDRTLDAAGDVDPGFLKGVQLVHDKLASVLADFGLSRIDETDVAFDPTRHEAVQQVAADEDRDEPVVTQVLRPGYELGGRTLRAAMVAVEQ
jgi:molecular chaperone GrpE